MPTLSLYLLRRIATPFALALLVVLFALGLERLLRIVQTFTDQGAPIGRAIEIFGYLIPHYLGLAVPTALFLAVLLTFRQLREGHELVAILTAGVPLRRMLLPILGVALVLSAAMLLNGGLAQPHARYAYRAALHEVTEATMAFHLQPGVFQRVNDRLVVRADEIRPASRSLVRFFADARKRDGTRSLITAAEAQVRNDPASGELIIELRDGIIVTEGPGALSGSVDFEQYTWSPPVDPQAPYGPRGQDKRELTLVELVAGGTRPPDTTPAEMRSELHGRLIHVLSLPVLAVLAVPLALLGGGRAGKAYGLILGVALLVLYEKMVGLGQALAADGTVSPWLGVWGPFAALLALTSWLMAHASESSGWSLLVWSARKIRALGSAPVRRVAE